jgi:KaiC/GvpD/RAD55 family RecA-like ATPase
MSAFARLRDGHLRELRASGLSDETIAASGIYSVSAAEASDLLGYGVGPALAFPYPANGHGAPPFIRVKLDHAGSDGKRYRTRTGAGNRLYIPPLVSPTLLADVATPLFITEGEKKCLKAAQEGLACVGLAGVWNWKTTKGKSGPTIPLSDFDALPLRNRTVYIVFDSDIVTNDKVKKAEAALAAELARRGATVSAIRLAAGPGGAKVGLDDYLLAQSVEAFRALEPIPLAAAGGNPAVQWARGRALYQRVARPVAHLVEGLIPAAGTVLVTGEDKSGKTTIALLLTLSYLHGTPFLGRAVPRPGRVIIVSEEDDADELRDRVRALHQGLALAYPDLVTAPDDPASLALVEDRLVWEARDGWRLDDPVLLAALVAQITALRGRDPDGAAILVLIDSLQAVRGLSDPGKPEGVALLKAALRQLSAAGAVVLLIAHARKVVSGGKRTSRASQEVAANHELAAEAAATIGLMAMGPRADAPVRVDLVTKRGKSQTVGYLRIAYTPETWPPETITITVEDAPSADARAEATDAKVLVALPVFIDGVSGVAVEAVVKASKLGDRTVRRSLDRLISAEKCLVTGVTTKHAKLYARMTNADA